MSAEFGLSSRVAAAALGSLVTMFSDIIDSERSASRDADGEMDQLHGFIQYKLGFHPQVTALQRKDKLLEEKPRPKQRMHTLTSRTWANT